MKKLFLAVSMIFLVTGCSVTKPAITEYKLIIKNLGLSSDVNEGCKDRSLKISQAFSPSSLMSLKMSYVQGNGAVYTYSQAQWSNSPNQEITAQVLKAIRDANIFKNTQNPKSRTKSDLILEVNIEDFMQYYNDDLSKSHVKVMINLSLIDTKTSKVIATKTFNSTKDVQTLDAKGGVKALDGALDMLLIDSVKFLNGVCR